MCDAAAAFQFDFISSNFCYKESEAAAAVLIDTELLNGLDPTIMSRDVAEHLSHEVTCARYVAWESTTVLR